MVENHPLNSIPHSHSLSRAIRLGAALSALLLAIAPFPSYAQSNDPLPEVESAAENDPVSDDTRFQCQLHNGQFTVMYLPESQPGRAYPWATPTSMGGGWDAETRCYTISDRLEAYRPEGLAELQVGVENGYDIVCATTEQIPGLCKIVFTVPLGQNPVVTRDLVFENLTLADGGSDTTIVNTFTGTTTANILGEINQALGSLGDFSNFPTRSSTRDGINLKPFLDTADGGTGTALKPNSVPLSPDNFR